MYVCMWCFNRRVYGNYCTCTSCHHNNLWQVSIDPRQTIHHNDLLKLSFVWCLCYFVCLEIKDTYTLTLQRCSVNLTMYDQNFAKCTTTTSLMTMYQLRPYLYSWHSARSHKQSITDQRSLSHNDTSSGRPHSVVCDVEMHSVTMELFKVKATIAKPLQFDWCSCTTCTKQFSKAS